MKSMVAISQWMAMAVLQSPSLKKMCMGFFRPYEALIIQIVSSHKNASPLCDLELACTFRRCVSGDVKLFILCSFCSVSGSSAAVTTNSTVIHLSLEEENVDVYPNFLLHFCLGAAFLTLHFYAMDEKEEPETVAASLRDSENKPIPIRLMLYPDALLVQKQEWVSIQLDEEDEVFLNMVREVEVTREPGAGFGLCVKGGSEHRLPVLISRLVKGEAAERCGQLLVGDAILRVDGVNVESCTHDEVVSLLKEVKENKVSLSVRHFRPASYFLNKGNEVRDGPISAKQDGPPLASLPRLEKDWLTALTIPLLYARVSKYVCGTDTER
ncbi:gamma-1-syntrophin, partial [Plakobranchus ocellatus]